MKKEAYYVEILPDDGVAITRGSADGDGRPVLQDGPAISFVCGDAKMAVNMARIVLEGENWTKERGVGVDIHVSRLGYEITDPRAFDEIGEDF